MSVDAAVADPSAEGVNVSSSTESANENGKIFSMDILDLTRKAQNQHGLQHDDYCRYRQYCARKLERLRDALDLRMAKGKKFTIKYPTAADLKDVRVLHLLLFDAERAWAYAMELKAEVSEDVRKKHHLIKRLRKATMHAARLEAICESGACDARTVLDAKAYSTWLQGSLSFERQQWQDALDKLATAKAIYEKLADVGTPAQQALCHARIEKIEPVLRFCAYQLKATDVSSVVQLRSEMAAAGVNALTDKFQALLLSDPSLAAVETLTLAGHVAPVRSQLVRQHVARARSIAATLQEQDASATSKEEGKATSDDKLALYDRLLMAYSDALRVATDEIQQDQEAQTKIKTQRGEETEKQLRLVQSALLCERLIATNERNLLLAQAAITNNKHQDAAKLMDSIIANWSEIRAVLVTLANSNDAEAAAVKAEVAETDIKISLYKGRKCLHIGLSLEPSQRWNDVYALYNRTLEYIQQARSLLATLSTPLSDKMKRDEDALNTLESEIRGRLSLVKASAFLEQKQEHRQQQQQQQTSPAKDQRGRSSKGASKAPPQFTVASLVALGSATATTEPFSASAAPTTAANAPLLDLPPRVIPIAAKPVLFDLAERYIDFPQVRRSAPTTPAAAPSAAAKKPTAAAAPSKQQPRKKPSEEEEEQQEEQQQQGGGIRTLLSSWWGGNK